MVTKRLALLLMLLMPACWTGIVEVTGTYTEVLMNGHIDYYVKATGTDLEVTEAVYNVVKQSLENNPGCALVCDFEKLLGSSIYDDIVYCRVKGKLNAGGA